MASPQTLRQNITNGQATGRYFLQVTGHRSGLQVTVVAMIKQPYAFINDNPRPKDYYLGLRLH